MPNLRRRAISFFAMVAVFVLCLSTQHGPVVSAKDKVKTTAAAENDDSPASSSATDGEEKPLKGKAKAGSTKKKARPEKAKKNKKGSSGDSDSSSGTSNGTGLGSGSGPALSGGNGSGTAGNTTTNNTPGASSKGQPAVGSQPATGAAAGSSTTAGTRTNATGSRTNGAASGAVAQAGAAGQGPDPKLVQKVIDIQNRNHAGLLSQKGIAAVGTGMDEDGNLVIKVLTTGADNPQIPKAIEGVPVVERLTGPIHPLQITPGSPLRQQRLPRATPIGVSAIDDTGLCATGTLGCRLRDNHGKVYALSNNHVFANENAGVVGVDVAVQPGPLDDSCTSGVTGDIIGTLAAFVPIDVTTTGTNTVDCAIVSTTKLLVNTSTLADGYGVPTSKTVIAFLGQKVQKYGRTTGYTSGTVTMLNVAFPIAYTPGIANFIKQIEITPDPQYPAFSIPGDSGSLVVDMNRNPVALLFAGNGFTTECNPINDVLSKLATELILTPGVPPDTTLTIDDSPPTPSGKEGRSTPNSP